MSSLETLLNKWLQEEKPPIVKLLNKDHIPVAALYLDRLKLNLDHIVISTTNTDEKYYLYLDGIAVFFTYYSKEN